MISKYLLVLGLTYLEYFTFWFFLEYAKEITWFNIKFWLTYTPFVTLFFFLIDSWVVATMIYTTFAFPYLLVLYSIKNVNRKVFSINRVFMRWTYY